MYVKVHKPNAKQGANKGSASNVIDYLSKEDKKGLDYITDDKLEEIKNFYDQDNNKINQFEALNLIDDHSKGLEKKDTKFFMLTINPSQNEILHLKNRAIDRSIELEKEGIKQTPQSIFNQDLMHYTRECMEEYAKGFHRTINDRPLSVDDLNYVARIETERTYKWNDKEVLHNKEVRQGKEGEYKTNEKGEIIKEGMKKDGNQTHIHIIVSRYDNSKTIKLSPCSNSKGRSENHVLNGEKVQVGFDRNDFSKNCEKVFDKEFNYDRKKEYSTEYRLEQNANSNQQVGGKIVNKEGEINAIDMTEKLLKLSKIAIENPKEVLNSIKNISTSQMKEMTVPELKYLTKDGVLNELNIKDKVIQKIKQEVKNAILSGGLEM